MRGVRRKAADRHALAASAPRTPIPMPLSEGEETLALQIRSQGLPEPVRQHQFAKEIGREWQFDFAWPDPSICKLFGCKLALEVEGEVHRTQGRFRGDLNKYNAAALMGWTVIRLRPIEIKQGAGLALLEALSAGGDPFLALGCRKGGSV